MRLPALLILMAACDELPPLSEPLPRTEAPDAVVTYVTQEVIGDTIGERYTQWARLPGTTLNQPLGLPVHGRYTNLHVNDIADGAVKKWLDPGTLSETVDFPDGSIIVKANAMKPPDDPSQPADPGVLTIMYKPGGDYCQTAYLYKEGGCYGGEWMFIFHQIPGSPLHGSFEGDVHVQDFCVTCHASGADDDYVRSLQRMRRALQPPTRPGSPAGTPPTGLTDAFCEAPTLSATLPPDVAMDPNSVTAKAPLSVEDRQQRMFDCLSWRSFIALNWPASAEPGKRGEPDPAAAFWDPERDSYASTGGNPRVRVWEQYKEVYELFQAGEGRLDWDPATTTPPRGWTEPPTPPDFPGCRDVGDERVLMMTTKNRSARGGEGVINETGQAFAGQFGTLRDQNRNLVRYDVRMNRSEYEFILDSGYAATRNITPGGPVGVLGTQMTLPDNRSEKYGEWGGTMEVKGSWRQLCFPGESCACLTEESGCAIIDKPEEFYTERVWVFDAEKETCTATLMGLVGMHIAHKTWWSPQWVWSTFEHTSLVSEKAGETASGKSLQSNSDDTCPPEEGMPPCEVAPFLAADPCCPNVPFDTVKHPDTPSQVTRLQAVAPVTDALNKTYASLEGIGPFANYILIGTQWPVNGRVPGDEANIHTRPCNADADPAAALTEDCYIITPQLLRNTSMESFMATYTRDADPHQISNRGCLNCHGEAGSDFSYVWLDAVNQRVKSAIQ